jgi:phthiocerol/phenolphthiocerol synthesis type-I polyketide synthase B
MTSLSTLSVAIVGIGCRFPGGITDAESFWRFVSEGRDAIAEIPQDRMDVGHYFDPRAATPGRMMSRRGGFLERIDEFDAEFFSISPREAECLDPQQRLLLETAWEALEDAGQDIRSLEGSPTGVFIGQWINDFEARLFADPEGMDFYKAQGSGRYASSGRISYALGLRGPSLTLDTACSSSLVAVHLAVRSIRSGECQIALAGGANIILQPNISIAYSQSRMMAADGRCKFGDASADGYVRSEGAGLVVLKALDRAIADGDRVYAIVRGSATNHDGRSSGFMGRPSRSGQEELLRTAYRDAGLDAGGIGYVEAHGAGTRAGDPVEFEALAAVLGRGGDSGSRIQVGSVKTNLGHTEGAAGVAGLIKVALALHHEAVPASLHHHEPNPTIPWGDMPLAIPRRSMPWPRGDRPRIAGVTAFGIAGTNAHVVLEEAPADVAAPNIGRSWKVMMLPLSAQNRAALRALAARYADLIERDSGPALQDVCWSAATRRTPLDHRAVFVAADRAAMGDGLRRYADGAGAAAQSIVRADVKPKIVFVCPGQGAQWVGMVRQLVAHEPVFCAALQRCDQAARPFVDWSIIEQLSAESDSKSYRLDQIDVIQPVLVAIAIAYAALLRGLGIEPDAVVGHSMGDIAAACIAGVIDLEQAMHIICRRGALMRRTSGKGSMALVDLSMEETGARLVGWADRLSVAASNSPRSSVISGDPDALRQVIAELERDDVFCRLVKVDVASHSPQMDSLADELATDLAGLTPSEARIPIWSTVLGRRAAGHEFAGAYWGWNLRRTVHFTNAVSQLLEDGISIFIELGPHPILLHSVQQTAQSLGREVTMIASGRREEGDLTAICVALGQLWAAGYAVDWQCVMRERGHTVALPLYPWQRTRYWAAAAEIGSGRPGTRAASLPPNDESRGWLYQLRWEASDLPAGPVVSGVPSSSWLILSTDCEAASALAAPFMAAAAIAKVARLDDLDAAIKEFARDAGSPSGIIVVATDGPDTAYLPLRALQAILKAGWTASPKLWLVTRGGQPVADDGKGRRVSVDQAALWGSGRVIAEEHPDLWGGLVDLDPDADPLTDAVLLLRHVLAADGEDQVAFRLNQRYVLRLARDTERGNRLPVFSWRTDVAYLITGGLGDAGLHVARAMAARGVRRLVLLNRTPLPPRGEWSKVEPESELGQRILAILDLESAGVAVHVAAVDVGDETQLRAFLDRYKAEVWPPIRGVIHAAVSLDNRLASAMDRAAFDAVVGPKLRAAQLLDRLLPDLDLLVLFSSMGGFLAHPGIANYAAANSGLDALAHDRRARGRPALSIAWGPWENTGLATGKAGEGIVAEFARQGIRSFSPECGASLFAWLCGRTDPFVAVLPISWQTFQQARAGRDLALVRGLLDEPVDAVAQKSELGGQLAAAGSAERRKIFDGVIRNAVGAVLKIPPSRLDPHRDLGTMRHRLEAALGRPLSATLAWNYPTVEAIVTHLAGAEPVAASSPAPVSFETPPTELSDRINQVAELSDEEAIAALRTSAFRSA